MSFEVISLVVISFAIGVGIVQQEHGSLVGLVILVLLSTIGMLTNPHITVEVLVLTIPSMLIGGATYKMWHLVIKNKNNKLQKNNMKKQQQIDPSLSLEYQESFKRGLNKKYPDISVKNEDREWVDRLRKNFQANLESKYGPLKSNKS